MENNQEQVAPQPVPSELPQALQSNQKPALLKWLLITFLFSLAVFGGILYVQNANKSQQTALIPTQTPQISPSPTPDVTANWKTYTNKELGFTIKYPEELRVKETFSTSQKLVMFSNNWRWENEYPDTKKYVGIWIELITASPKQDLKDWMLKNVEILSIDGKIRYLAENELNTYIVGNITGFTFVGGIESVIKYAYFKNNGNIYRFLLQGYDTGGSYKENPDAERLFDQILQTFRFLDQQTQKVSCRNVEPNAGSGISFPAAFCYGLVKESCQNVKSETACESHDVVTIEDGSMGSGKDGIVDCEWNTTTSACAPK